ncbi:DUF6894 family protein [Methylobacterium oxalidis]|uniref:DUF6894 family protein n=1 Tax=Methylobacterium oxalidis TaxID=944322 RepID=UPI0035A22EF6
MTRFFFDLHSDSLSTWDDDGLECEGADGILRHAMDLLNGLSEAEALRSGHAVVSVRDDSGFVLLTATLKPNSEPSLRWARPAAAGPAIG